MHKIQLCALPIQAQLIFSNSKGIQDIHILLTVMKYLCHSKEDDKAPQMVCQDTVGCSWMNINSINLYKILLLVCKKIYSENDLIISLWKYSSGVNGFRRKYDHLATVLISNFLNLRIKNIFFKNDTYFQVTHMAVHSLSVDLSTFPYLCPIYVIIVHFCVNSVH